MMRCWCRRWVLILVVATNPAAVFGGEALGCFKTGLQGGCEQEALPHVEFKSVVLQFVDPGRTQLGEGLARILWRQILESVSDLERVGVILAYDRAGAIEEALGETDVNIFLQREYHDAALRIAEQQRVQMSVWGAVLEDGGELFVQTFLTLRDSDEDPWTWLSLQFEQPRSLQLRALLGGGRINLPPIRRAREDLFERWFVTRCALDGGCLEGVALRAEPTNDAPIIDRVPVGARVEVVDMNRQWLKLKASTEVGGITRWINIYHVEMFPEYVQFFERRRVNLRDAPGGDRLGQVDLDGRFEVHDAARHGRFGEPWYRIEIDGRRGWVAGRLVNRRSYMFPEVHLIAGLYRYGRGQYDQARQELEAFLAVTPKEENVTRASALKFLAAAQLANDWTGGANLRSALKNLEIAVDLTPFDPSLYMLRAVVRAGAREPHELERAVLDIERALKLDPYDSQSQRLLSDFISIQRDIGLGIFTPGHSTRRVKEELEALHEAFIKRRRTGDDSQ